MIRSITTKLAMYSVLLIVTQCDTVAVQPETSSNTLMTHYSSSTISDVSSVDSLSPPEMSSSEETQSSTIELSINQGSSFLGSSSNQGNSFMGSSLINESSAHQKQSSYFQYLL